MAARKEATSSLWPTTAGRHRVVCALHADRNYRDAVALRDHRGTGTQPPDLAIAGAGAFGIDQEVPALLDRAVEVVERPIARTAAAPAHDRHGVEDERDGVRDEPLLVEVVRGGGHRSALPPLQRE